VPQDAPKTTTFGVCIPAIFIVLIAPLPAPHAQAANKATPVNDAPVDNVFVFIKFSSIYRIMNKNRIVQFVFIQIAQKNNWLIKLLNR
jgi:hypothetical protein